VHHSHSGVAALGRQDAGWLGIGTQSTKGDSDFGPDQVETREYFFSILFLSFHLLLCDNEQILDEIITGAHDTSLNRQPHQCSRTLHQPGPRGDLRSDSEFEGSQDGAEDEDTQTQLVPGMPSPHSLSIPHAIIDSP